MSNCYNGYLVNNNNLDDDIVNLILVHATRFLFSFISINLAIIQTVNQSFFIHYNPKKQIKKKFMRKKIAKKMWWKVTEMFFSSHFTHLVCPTIISQKIMERIIKWFPGFFFYSGQLEFLSNNDFVGIVGNEYQVLLSPSALTGITAAHTMLLKI